MRRPWDRERAATVFVGGAAGAAVRWALVSTFEVAAGDVPWPVLAVNVAGSVLLGLLLAVEWSHASARLLLHDLGGIGFCGGLTTFSTFSVDVARLVRDGHEATATLYALASIAGAVAGVLTGAALLRRVRAVTLPLEEQP